LCVANSEQTNNEGTTHRGGGKVYVRNRKQRRIEDGRVRRRSRVTAAVNAREIEVFRQFALLSCVVIQSVATSALAAACRDAPGTRTTTTTTTTTSLRKRDVDLKRAVALCKTTRESATGNASLSVGDSLSVIGSENGNTDAGGDSDRTPRGDESNFGSNVPSRGGGSADRRDRDTGGRSFDGNHHDNGGGGGGNGNGSGNQHGSSGPGGSDENKSVENKELFDVLLSPLTDEGEQNQFRETRISFGMNMENYILNSLSTTERADILAAIEDALRGGDETKMPKAAEKAKAITDMLFKFKVFVTNATAENLRKNGVNREKIQSWTPKDSESLLEHRVETTREQAKAAYVAQFQTPLSDEEIEKMYETWKNKLEEKLSSLSKAGEYRAYVDNTVSNYAYGVRRGKSDSAMDSDQWHFYELFYNGIAGGVEGPTKRWKTHFDEILSPTVRSQTCHKVARWYLLTKRSSSFSSDNDVIDVVIDDDDDDDDDEDDRITSVNMSSSMDEFFEFYPVWIPTAENISKILSTFIDELNALYSRSGGVGVFIVPIGALALFPAFLSCFRELTTTLGFKTHKTFETREERKFSANVQMPLGSARPPPVVLRMEATLTLDAFRHLPYVSIFYDEEKHRSDWNPAVSEAKKNMREAASLLQGRLEEWVKEYSPQLNENVQLPKDTLDKYDIYVSSRMTRRESLKRKKSPLLDYVDSDHTRKSAARLIVHFFVEIAKKLRGDLFLSKDPSVRLCFLFGDINKKTKIRNSQNSFLVQLQNLLHGASGGEELIANVLLRAIAEKEFIERIIGENSATKVWRDMILRAVSIVKPKQDTTAVSKFDADFPLFSMSARRSLENFVYLGTSLAKKFHRFKSLTKLWTERPRKEIEKSDGLFRSLLLQKLWMLNNKFSKKMALGVMFSVIVIFIDSSTRRTANSSESTIAEKEKELMRSSKDKLVQSYMSEHWKS
jgi:hypothetical protein